MLQFEMLYRSVKQQQDIWAEQARLDALIGERRAERAGPWRTGRQAVGRWLITAGTTVRGAPHGLLGKSR